MSKGRSGHFHGTAGAYELENFEYVNPVKTIDDYVEYENRIEMLKNIFSKDGMITADSIKNNVSLFSGYSVYDYARVMKECGYAVVVKASKKSRSGAMIIQVLNTDKVRNISQFQVSPGGGRHGPSPYVKISTIDLGTFKIVDGSKDTYKIQGNEKSEILFRR